MTESLCLAEADVASAAEAEAYLRGAAHDSTFSRIHRTTRFCQSDPRWLEVLAALLATLDRRCWSYREGRSRTLWVLETTWTPSGASGALSCAPDAYVRGYFDAEGGIPRSREARFYIQFVQKDRDDLSVAREILLSLGIRCGGLHNPSARADPNYWRFYVASASHLAFIERVRSWHPRKRSRLEVQRRQSLATAPLDGSLGRASLVR